MPLRRRSSPSATGLLGLLAVLSHDEQRGDQDLEVEPKRPVLEIEVVPLDAVGEGGLPPQPMDLRPAGDARLDAVAVLVAGDRTLEDLDELRALGPRPDQ